MKKLAVLCLGAALALNACGSLAENKDELHIALGALPSNLDVCANSATVAQEVADVSIFETLVTMNNKYEVTAELATSWEMSEDATEYTWHLREGVLFHNGQEMTADDATASLNRWLASASNAQSMIGDATFVAADKYTVTLKMDHPCAYVNEMMAGLGQRPAVMPKSVIDAIGDTGVVSEYIGTGPYKFVSWDDQQIRLTRFDDYKPYGTEGEYSGWVGYKSAPTKDIIFDIVTDSSTVVAGLQTGEYDVATDIPNDNLWMFQNNDDYKVSLAECEMPMLIFNKQVGKATDAKVRQGIQAILNCDEIMYGSMGDESLYSLYSSYDFATVTDWYTDAGSQYYNQSNPELGVSILKEAGWTDDDVFTILVPNDDEAFYKQGIICQNQLQNAGIKCELLAFEWATYASYKYDHPENYDAFITSFSPKVVPTMNLYLSPTWSGWCTDERIQSDLSSIGSDSSKAHAIETWKSLQEYMYAESVPVVKFGTYMKNMIASSKVENCEFFEHACYCNATVAE